MIIGIDMGGTNIDGVVIDKGKVIKKIKNKIDRKDLFNTIWSTLSELIDNVDKEKLERINLSTTVSTNAIVEDKASKVGMIVQTGPGVNIDLDCGDEKVFISGYTDHRGNIVEELKEEEIQKAIEIFKRKNIKNVGVITKFSTRNPTSENKIKKLLEVDFEYISLGHRMSGKLNFPRRIYTTYFNSAIYSVFREFYININRALKDKKIDVPIYMLKADGGTFDFDEALKKPVETILSGPAASFMGINALSHTKDDSILIDIGGTTTDIFFLVDGLPIFEPLGIELYGFKTLIRSINSTSIGLGGDSEVYVEDGIIKISTRKTEDGPTFTDAMVVLDYMEVQDKKSAEKNIKDLGEKINKNIHETSKLILDGVVEKIYKNVNEILDAVNSRPIYTIKELLKNKKIRPRTINIIGGPAKTLAPMIEKKFNMTCYYPSDYAIANAIGAALAKPTSKITLNVDTSLKKMNVPELDIYKRIPSSYNLSKAREYALELLYEEGKKMGIHENNIEAEVVEKSSFNMVEGFFTKGKNIRLEAQIRPGLIENFRGDVSES